MISCISWGDYNSSFFSRAQKRSIIDSDNAPWGRNIHFMVSMTYHFLLLQPSIVCDDIQFNSDFLTVDSEPLILVNLFLWSAINIDKTSKRLWTDCDSSFSGTSFDWPPAATAWVYHRQSWSCDILDLIARLTRTDWERDQVRTWWYHHHWHSSTRVVNTVSQHIYYYHISRPRSSHQAEAKAKNPFRSGQ